MSEANEQADLRLRVQPIVIWRSVDAELPELDLVCVLYDELNDQAFIGSRVYVEDAEGWLWSNSYGSIWWNGKKWDADTLEADDDYQVTHWQPLPVPCRERSKQTI